MANLCYKRPICIGVKYGLFHEGLDDYLFVSESFEKVKDRYNRDSDYGSNHNYRIYKITEDGEEVVW